MGTSPRVSLHKHHLFPLRRFDVFCRKKKKKNSGHFLILFARQFYSILSAMHGMMFTRIFVVFSVLYSVLLSVEVN